MDNQLGTPFSAPGLAECVDYACVGDQCHCHGNNNCKQQKKKWKKANISTSWNTNEGQVPAHQEISPEVYTTNNQQ
jgi:hypothetical protein